MPRPLARQEAEQRLRGEDWAAIRDALQRLPPDVDAKLAAREVLGQLGEGYGAAWSFGRSCQRIPPHVIRECLRLLPKEPLSPERIFLREAVDAGLDDAALASAWVAALRALLDLSLTYGWGSKQRKARFKALAAQPTVVRAVQAAVVGTNDPTIDMLAVLAVDASEGSIDALLPVFAKGGADSRLEQLAVHATRNAAMTAMLETVSARRAKKEAASSAVAFTSTLLGLDPPLKSVHFRISLSCAESETGGVPLYQGSLSVDSRWDAWWSVHLTRVDRSMSMKSTHFGASGEDRADDLRVGTSQAIEELPAWVARAQKKLKITWNRGALVSGSVRGKKRALLEQWLFSALG